MFYRVNVYCVLITVIWIVTPALCVLPGLCAAVTGR